MRKAKIPTWLFVVALIGVPVSLYALVTLSRENSTCLPFYGGIDHEVSDFQLIDQQGSLCSIKDWENKIVVVNFFFSHCPVVCPKMTENLLSVQQIYSNDPRLLIQSFTVDPERDSTVQLAKYAARFGINISNWKLLTGDKKRIYQLARKSFLIEASEGDGGLEDFIHSERLVLLDMNKKIRGFYNGTSAAETKQLIRDISILKKENGQ